MNLLRRKAIACCICLTALTDMAAYNLREVTNNDGLNSNFVLSLSQMQDGLMVIGTINGLNFYDGNQIWTTGLTNQQFLGNLVKDMATVGDNQMWVLTGHGLNIITDKGRHRQRQLWPRAVGAIPTPRTRIPLWFCDRESQIESPDSEVGTPIG